MPKPKLSPTYRPAPSCRSVLSAKAADEAEPLKPGKVWDEHSILLLEGGEPLPDKLVAEIQQEVKKVRKCSRPLRLFLSYMCMLPSCARLLSPCEALGGRCLLGTR